MSDKALFSCKMTEKSSFRLTLKDWNALLHDSFEEDKFPIMALDIKGTELYVIDKELLDVLMEALNGF